MQSDKKTCTEVVEVMGQVPSRVGSHQLSPAE